MTDYCFDIHELWFSYGRRSVIRGVSQTITGKAFYGLLGPNGCGKTTLLDLLVGHNRQDSGRIHFMGKALQTIGKPELSRHIALVSQNYYINFPYTVMDVIMMGRYPHIPRFSSPGASDYEVVEQVMKMTGVKDLRNQPVTELSGGERQRTVFARALAQDTGVLLLDEATSNLDISHTIMPLDMVKQRVRETGLTVISVFQDINLAAVYCDEMIFMKDGQVVAAGPTEEMIDAALLELVYQVQSEIRFEPLYQAKQAVFNTGRMLS